MTDIDVSQIKVGDVVGVRVNGSPSQTGHVGVEAGRGHTVFVPPSAIVSHTPAPKPALKVGDRVRDGDGPVRTVAWIEDGHAFLSPLKGTTYMAPWTLSEVETWERLS